MRPSTRLGSNGADSASVAENRSTDAAGLRRQLRGDLDWITMKALEKDPARRYASAGEFAADIQRHLNHEPVLAAAPGTVYRVRKFVRRNRGLVFAAVALLTTLVVAAVICLAFAIRESRALASERQARAGEQLESYVARIQAARGAMRLSDVRELRENLKASPSALRGWEWYYLQAAGDASLGMVDLGHSIVSAAMSPDGDYLAVGAADGSVQLLEIPTLRTLSIMKEQQHMVRSLAVSGDGRFLVAGSQDGTVCTWEVSSSHSPVRLWSRKLEEIDVRVTISPENTWLATGGSSEQFVPSTVRFWNLATGEPMNSPPRECSTRVGALAVNPKGRALAAAAFDDCTIWIWDLTPESKPIVLPRQGGGVYSLAFSPDGSRLASAGQDRVIRVWSSEQWSSATFLMGHESNIWSVAFSPDGRCVASASADRTIRLWEKSPKSDYWRDAQSLRGHSGAVRAIAYAPEKELLASAGEDGNVRLWSSNPDQPPTILRGHEELTQAACFSPDGKRVASASGDGTVRLWNATTGHQLLNLQHNSPVRDVVFSSDGQFIVSGSEDGLVKVWNAEAGTLVTTLDGRAEGTPGGIRYMACSPDARFIASVTSDGRVLMWSMPSYELINTLDCDGQPANSLAFSPDSQSLAIAAGRDVWLWNVQDLSHYDSLKGQEAPVHTLAFRPDGLQLAAGADDGTIRIWNLDTRSCRTVIEDQFRVRSLTYNRDGSRLAATLGQETVRLRDADSGRELLSLSETKGAVFDICFSPDGTRLSAVGNSWWVRFWDTLPYRIRWLEREAALAQEGGDLDQAERLFRTAWQERRTALGEGQVGTIEPLGELIGCLLRQRRYAEAVPLAREYEECSRTHYGDAHVITQRAIQMLKEALTGAQMPSERHNSAASPIPTR